MKTTSLSSRRVVIAEAFADNGIAVLREAGCDIESQVGKDRASLIASLKDANGLIVRSETRVDAELLAAGPDLVVVARAGVGVDSIDVSAATQAGIVVLNVPAANTLAATEQTFALMLAMLRKVVPAANALREGVWDRNPFIGTELNGKTLGIIGLGRIGGNVAVRAKAFGMRLIAADPFITSARAESFAATLMPLDELLRTADIVTIHTPLNSQTRGMLDAAKLALLRPHAYLINCARGGLIDEAALLAALDADALAGAAIDVVAIEPPPPAGNGAKLHRHPKIVASPHLGGSTHEALGRIATELAADLVNVLSGRPVTGAVNVPKASDERIEPFVDLAFRLGFVLPQLSRGNGSQFTLSIEGEIAEISPEPLITALLTGYLRVTTDRRVSLVNADAIAKEMGIRVELRAQSEASEGFANLLRLSGGGASLAGTATAAAARLVEIDGYKIDAIPSGALILTEHRDVPGMVGKVGTVLGRAEINISAMQVSRERSGGGAIMLLSVDRQADAATLKEIRAIAGIASVRSLETP